MCTNQILDDKPSHPLPGFLSVQEFPRKRKRDRKFLQWTNEGREGEIFLLVFNENLEAFWYIFQAPSAQSCWFRYQWKDLVLLHNLRIMLPFSIKVVTSQAAQMRRFFTAGLGRFRCQWVNYKYISI